MISCLLLFVIACPLTLTALRRGALIPPAVMLDLGSLWIGDVCRDTRDRVVPIACPPIYNVTIKVNGTGWSHTLLRIPLAPSNIPRRRF
jgi:hypothetical protein